LFLKDVLKHIDPPFPPPLTLLSKLLLLFFSPFDFVVLYLAMKWVLICCACYCSADFWLDASSGCERGLGVSGRGGWQSGAE